MTETRFSKRQQYIEGWYEMDSLKLSSACASDFVFDDPQEPAPVTRNQLKHYMLRWDARVRAAGGGNQWKLAYEVREDKGGILTDWEWWEVVGTDLQGMAMVQTSNRGVLIEKITYFSRAQSYPPVLSVTK